MLKIRTTKQENGTQSVYLRVSFSGLEQQDARPRYL